MSVPQSPLTAFLATEAYVTVLGTPVRFFRAGQGLPVVLLHGLGEAAVIWHLNAGPLAQRYTVVAPDLPGHGHSPPPRWRYTVEQGSRWLLAFLDSLGLEEVCLVGNSLGGLLAASAALQQPARVRRLVLEDSAGLGREIVPFLRLMSLPLVGEALARPTMGNLRRLMRLLFYDPSVVPEEFLETLHRERTQPGNKAALLRIVRSGITVLGVKGSARIVERLAQLSAPTLVAWGRQDAIFPVGHGHRAVERLPNATLHVLEKCGHWPHMEHPDTFNRLVLDFLS